MVQSLFGVEEVRPGRGDEGHDQGKEDHSAAFHCDLRICSTLITTVSRVNSVITVGMRDLIPHSGVRTVRRHAPRILPSSFRAGHSVIRYLVSSPSFLKWRLTATLPWPWARLTERSRPLSGVWSLSHFCSHSWALIQACIPHLKFSSWAWPQCYVSQVEWLCFAFITHTPPLPLLSHYFLHEQFVRSDWNVSKNHP